MGHRARVPGVTGVIACEGCDFDKGRGLINSVNGVQGVGHAVLEGVSAAGSNRLQGWLVKQWRGACVCSTLVIENCIITLETRRCKT
jgi:hypothetical protein